MRNISKSSVKKIIKQVHGSNVIVSDSAADAIVKILEQKARRIAKYAVKRAKDKKRATVTEEDIDTYRLKYGG